MNIRKHYRRLVPALAIASALAAGTAYASTPEHKPHHDQRVIRLTEASDVPKLTYVDVGDPGLQPAEAAITGGTGSYRTATGEADIHVQADQIVLRLTP